MPPLPPKPPVTGGIFPCSPRDTHGFPRSITRGTPSIFPWYFPVVLPVVHPAVLPVVPLVIPVVYTRGNPNPRNTHLSVEPLA